MKVEKELEGKEANQLQACCKQSRWQMIQSQIKADAVRKERKGWIWEVSKRKSTLFAVSLSKGEGKGGTR